MLPQLYPINIVIGLISLGRMSAAQNCSGLVLNIANSSVFRPATLELVFQSEDGGGKTQAAALAECFLKAGRDTEHVLELVSVTAAAAASDGADRFDSENCCRTLCKGSRVQDQAYISTILTEGSHSFKYVQGTYIVRHRKCSCSKGYCFRCQTKWCSTVQTYGEGSVAELADSCGAGEEKLSALFHSSRFPDSRSSERVENCTVDVTAVYPACSLILSYSHIQVSIYQAIQ